VPAWHRCPVICGRGVRLLGYASGIAMPLESLRVWLGLGSQESDEPTPLGETLQALENLEPERAKFLAAFAYILGRVAHADRRISPEETRAMEAIVRDEGQLAPDQAAAVVKLATKSNLLFGGTADFLVARELSALATYEQKLSLLRCLFALSSVDNSISLAEESELHRIANELRIDRADLVTLRVAHQQQLPGRSAQ
jgi:uncharacterized tellurite resistance protein B-like protein